ncbi:MAG TPA: Uma2 family endonuclease [Mesorhizobium sp.]|jgi:Uma2 family endonuclease|nr:Uma2 family endonuclease [Mesorhizobium sp.]
MNIQSRYPTTPDEFLRWNEGREGKREFVRGQVEELMINVTRNHAEIALNFAAELRARLDRKLFSLGSADFGVRTPEGIRYPDAYVDRRTSSSRGTDLAASQPVLVAEVLSPSSYGRDFVDKLADYEGIGSLQHYVILSHEEPRAWFWSRTADGTWPKKPQEIAGDEEAIELAGLGISIPMAELYAGIECRP